MPEQGRWSDPDLPFNREIAFTDVKGVHKPRLEKKQRKLIAKATPLLRKMLEPDEEIHLVTYGCSPYSALEFFTTGVMIIHLKRCLLVVTDRRILHLPTKTNFAPKMSVAEIRYGDVTELKVGSFLGSKLKVTFRGGKKEELTGLPGWAAKKMKALLPARSGQGAASMAARRRHLCPKCTQGIAADSYSCSGCGLLFKDKKTATKVSLLYPGGGYFYTRHPWFGLGDALVEIFLILMIALSLFMAFGSEGDPEALPLVAILVIFLAIEKAVTVYHAHHFVAERIPANRKFSPT